MGQSINDINNSTVIGNNINGINNSVKDVSVDKADIGNSMGRKSFYSGFNHTNSTRDFLLIITFVLSLFSGITVLFLLCTSFPRCENLQFDYIGVILGILSFLVTILIGWQIWNTISIDQKIRDEIIDRFKTVEANNGIEIDKKIKDYDLHLGSVLTHTKANKATKAKDAITDYFLALKCANESSYKDNIPSILADLQITMSLYCFCENDFKIADVKCFMAILEGCNQNSENVKLIHSSLIQIITRINSNATNQETR